MEVENTEEEVVDTQPTEEELYDSEYDKAWTDEELEQPNEELTDDVDVPDESVVEEDSNEEVITDEDTPVEESDNQENEFVKVLKWNKKEIPVTDEELVSLAQKGFDSEKKWQDAAKIRPFKDIIESNEFTVEDLQMLADIKKGKSSEALALLAEQSGIDVFDAEKTEYKPVVEDKNYELEDVITEINKNEDIANQMNDYVSSVPQSVKDTLISKPAILKGLNADMVNGIGQQIMPEVVKQLAINPHQDFLSLYQDVGHKVFSKQEAKEEVVDTKPLATREDKRKVAVSQKNSAPKKVIKDDYDASWDDDKHFNDVLSRLNGF